MLNEKILNFDNTVLEVIVWMRDNNPKDSLEATLSQILLDNYHKKTNISSLLYDSLGFNSDEPNQLKATDGKHSNSVKVGKVLRDIFLEVSGDYFNGIKPNDYEKYVLDFKKKLSEFSQKENKSYKFNILSGDDVSGVYHNFIGFQSGSHLSKSCMNSKPKEWFDIYTKNTDVFSLAVLYQNAKLVARALIMDLKNTSDSTKWDYFIDRIYFETPDDKNYLLSMIKKNISSRILFYDDLLISSNSIEITGIKINLRKTLFDKYPYLDTFEYLHIPYRVIKRSNILTTFASFYKNKGIEKEVQLLEGGFLSDRSYKKDGYIIFVLDDYNKGERIPFARSVSLIDKENNIYKIKPSLLF